MLSDSVPRIPKRPIDRTICDSPDSRAVAHWNGRIVWGPEPRDSRALLATGLRRWGKERPRYLQLHSGEQDDRSHGGQYESSLSTYRNLYRGIYRGYTGRIAKSRASVGIGSECFCGIEIHGPGKRGRSALAVAIRGGQRSAAIRGERIGGAISRKVERQRKECC